MTSQAGVKKSLDAARTSDVVEKVFAHRSSKKASAFSCPTRDRIDAVDHFISPKSGPRSLLWDFFNNVTHACRVETFSTPVGVMRFRKQVSRETRHGTPEGLPPDFYGTPS